MPTRESTATVLLEDQALRDGLQMEARRLTTAQKQRFFELLVAAGFGRVQVGAFVHPGKVPQMADTDTLVRALIDGDTAGTVVSALVLNAQGLDRALTCGISHVTLSASLSDTHSRRNAGRTAHAAIEEMAVLVERSRQAGISARAGLQCVFGCVYEGAVAEKGILTAAEGLVAAGATELNLADTTGMADPRSIRRVVGKLSKSFPDLRLSLHLHDTRGLGLANLFSGYEAGVRSFDVCAGGLGGCPFVTGAAGNVAAEDTVHLFESMGIPTGIDLTALCRAVAYLEEILGRSLPGKICAVIDAEKGERACA